MLKRRGVGLIVASLLLAFGAAWLAQRWMHARMRADAGGTDIPVVIATMEIPFATRVESRQLRVIRIPRNTQIANYFNTPDSVVGMIATQKILPGEILLHAQFTERPVGSTLAALLKPELRAITVRVDDVVGVAGFLLPGNHVDVVATRMVNQHAETNTVLRNLTVLAVDQTASQDKNAPVVVRAVTLEVTPKQAEVLVQAREQGSIQLTLRSPTAIDSSTQDQSATRPPVASVIQNSPAARRALPHAHPGRRSAARSARAPREEGTTIVRGTNVQHTPPRPYN